MSKSNAAETALLNLIFNATTWPEIAEDDTTAPSANLTVALHTADPGEAGDQTTNETAYTGYARISVARTSGGWTVTGNSVSPVANIDFGECSAAAGPALTHFSVGTGTSDFMLYSGAITPSITVAVGVSPRLQTSSTITED